MPGKFSMILPPSMTMPLPHLQHRRRPFSISQLALAMLLLVIFCTTCLCGCRNDADDAPNDLQLVVSIAPQADFVRNIAGDDASIMILVAPQETPETFQISPRQLATLSRARVWFQVGMTFEEQLEPRIRDNFPHLQIVPTHQGVTLRRMETHLDADNGTAADTADGDGHDDHSITQKPQPQGDTHHHAPGDHDPHIWLDPQLVKIQAANIAAGLIAANPDNRETYEQNLAAFQARLDQLDAQLRQMLAPLRGRRMLVAHPAFGYFADAYGLRQISVEIEGKEPTARQLAQLQEFTRRHNIRTIFVQPQFSPRTADVLADRIGARVIVIDPLAEGDYVANMRKMAETVLRALSGEGDSGD